MSDNIYFTGQGKLLLATRAATGQPGAMRWVGNASAVSIALETEQLQHNESYSGQRLVDLRIQTGKSATMSMTLESFSADNLALGLYGKKSTVDSASISEEVLPTGLVAGDIVRLAHPDVSTITIKDSTSGTAKNVKAEDFAIYSEKHGSIQIKKVTGYAQPFKVSYTHAGYSNVSMFATPPPERWVRFEGLNIADSNKAVLVELYRVSIDPLADLPLITTEVGQITLTGAALVDSTKAADGRLGQIGQVIRL